MKVYKFGGASTATAERMTALLPIIKEEKNPLLIVLSALGKTTNALEVIVEFAFKNDREMALILAADLAQKHLIQAKEMLDSSHYEMAEEGLAPYFGELNRAIENIDPSNYDYSYDQIVSVGELLSSLLFYFLLLQNGVNCEWVDIRKVVLTDDTFRDAVVDRDYTRLEAEAIIGRKLMRGTVVVTQGFIGSTVDGRAVTLGREGSDYTAAILAEMLKMDSLTIWKDVDGFQNADPKMFANTCRIDSITYEEVIEMAFYGAQIIHPKTIKPLQNNKIPLYVKCFLDPTLPGSVIIAAKGGETFPPMFVLKENQVLVEVTTKDFSFITESNLSKLYSIFHDLKVKINLIQNAAISFIACINNREDKVEKLIKALSDDYKVTLHKDVNLLTVRHFTDGIMSNLTDGKEKLLCQETRKTKQMVLREG